MPLRPRTDPSHPAKLPGPATAALLAWVLFGGVLAIWWALAWLERPAIGSLERWLRHVYRLGSADEAWIMRPDTHIHLMTALAGTSWAAFGLWLLRPCRLPWTPIGLMAVVAILDEATQAIDPNRSFNWGDVSASILGVALAMPLAWLLGNEAKRRRRRTGGTAAALPPRRAQNLNQE